MADDMKLIARCAATPAPGDSGTGKTTGRLPDELISEQVRRLAIFSAVMGALWTYGLVVDVVIVPLLMPQVAALEIHGAGIPIEVGGIVLSALMVLYMRRIRRTPRRLSASGT